MVSVIFQIFSFDAMLLRITTINSGLSQRSWKGTVLFQYFCCQRNYWNHVDSLCNANGWLFRADSNKLELHRDFIAKTVDLYSQILRYQMRFARHLNLPFLGRVLTDLAARNDWVGMLTGVQNTEGSINTTLDVLDRDTLNKVNDGVTIIIKNSEQSLVMLQKNQEGIEKTQEGVEVRYSESGSTTVLILLSVCYKGSRAREAG